MSCDVIGPSLDVAVSTRSSAEAGIVYDRIHAAFDSLIDATESCSGHSQADGNPSLILVAIGAMA